MLTVIKAFKKDHKYTRIECVDENGATVKLDKDTLIEEIEKGHVLKAKIQLYEGAKIVRFGSGVAISETTSRGKGKKVKKRCAEKPSSHKATAERQIVTESKPKEKTESQVVEEAAEKHIEHKDVMSLDSISCIEDTINPSALTSTAVDVNELLKEPLIQLTDSDREEAVQIGLVPERYKNAAFDRSKVNQNKRMLEEVGSRKVEKADNYMDLVASIVAGLKCRRLPERSYIIGAPNRFGKTSAVTEAIMLMHKQGMRAVPYISLSELHRLWGLTVAAYEKIFVYREYEEAGLEEFAIGLSGKGGKKPVNVVGRYSWDEYLNSTLLFCFLSGEMTKVEETKTLHHILGVRGAKGLPTICFMGTSLDIYTKDKNLRENYWSNMLAYEGETSYDRLTHVSCYEQKREITLQ